MTIAFYSAEPVDSGAMDRDRLKYLFKQVLGVDVDAIVQRVTASLAVERAREVREHSEEWTRYMDEQGGLVLLPKNVTDLGKRPRSRF